MKFDKKEAAGQPLPFSVPKNPQWVMLAALLLSYAAGYEYVDRCLGFGVASEYSAWRTGVLVFVALYTVVVELAAWAGDRKPSRTAAAWWCCWLVQSLAMAGWSLHTDDLGFWQVVAWHCTAIYYVLARNDLLAAGRTSCLVLLDGVAGMFAIPFGNFLLRTQLLWQALHRWWASHAGRKGRTLETAVSITAALLLGGAACATLAVYINLYGPTVRRIWAAWVLGALLLASVLAAVRLFCGIPAARMAFVAAAFSFSLLCCLPLERFCVDAQLARPDCDWQLLQRYTWQSSELDEYITQQAGENANLSE